MVLRFSNNFVLIFICGVAFRPVLTNLSTNLQVTLTKSGHAYQYFFFLRKITVTLILKLGQVTNDKYEKSSMLKVEINSRNVFFTRNGNYSI